MKVKESLEERRNLLERRANAVRSRLLLAIDALDARRQRVEAIGARAKDVAVPAILSLAGIALLVGAAGAGLGWYLIARRRRRFGHRLAMRAAGELRRRIRSLDLVSPPPLGRRVLDKVAISAASVIATALAKRTVQRLLTDGGRAGIGARDGRDVSISTYPGHAGRSDILVRGGAF